MEILFLTHCPLVSDIFAEHFAKVSSKDENKPLYRQHMREESHFVNFTTQRESYNMPFDMRELLYALAKSQNTAPGPDEMIYDMSKKSYETKLFILGIINKIFRNSEFPPTVGSRFMRVPIMRFPVCASDRNNENC